MGRVKEGTGKAKKERRGKSDEEEETGVGLDHSS
jgi:hypothetical protein